MQFPLRLLIVALTLCRVIPCTAEATRITQHVDSLLHELQNTSDSSRIPMLLSLSWELRNTAPEKSASYGLEAIDLATRYNDYENLAKAYSFVGVANRIMGRYSETIDYFFKGLETAREHNIPEQAGFAYLNLANLYIYQEHSSMAMDNIKKAESIALEIRNKTMLAYAYLYYGRASKLDEKNDSALFYYEKSLSIRRDLNQVNEQATCYKYIGDIYFAKGDFEKSSDYYKMSLEKLDVEQDQDLYANILIREAMISFAQKKYREANDLASRSLEIATDIGANMAIRDALRVLASISIALNDYKAAADYQEKVIRYNDILFSQKLSEKIFTLEFQMEQEQKEIKIDLLNKDNAIKELQLNRIRTITIGLSAIMLLLAALFVVVLVLFRHKRERTRLLELQNQEILRQRNSIGQKNQRLIEANDRLERSEENLRRMVQTKDKLFSIIAHDLRNPFMALAGVTEILRDNAGNLEPEEIADYASIIHESSHKLVNLIENLLQWANSQTGRLKIVPRNLLLRQLVDEVVKVLNPQAESKGISLINDIPEDLSVYADQESISTVIRNLVSNGIKYNEAGGRVTMSGHHEADMTVIHVADTGVGMSREAMERLFKIEESFTTEGTNHEPGTGLGLIICKEFVERHGGSIKVESTIGKGTTFIVELPDMPDMKAEHP